MSYTIQDYVKDALRTESIKGIVITDANGNYSEVPLEEAIKLGRILHAAMGMVTEAAELLDALKKHIYYGKPLDEVNLREELGDILWYFAITCDALGVDPSDIMERNIAKLRTRYPEKFNSEQAITRDLDREREILEKEPSPLRKAENRYEMLLGEEPNDK